MKQKLITKSVSNPKQIQASFDQQALHYAEQHGKADKLLQYRLGLFRKMAQFNPTDIVLDIGCGNGHHLRGLKQEFAKGMGIDFSAEMVRVAAARSEGMNLEFMQDDATQLKQIADQSVDKVICSGALEHMIDQKSVFKQVFRVLKKKGKLCFLTLNGAYIWYQSLAPALGLATQHYSTDHFLDRSSLTQMVVKAGFEEINIQPWSFIPKGDMPGVVGLYLELLDTLGKVLGKHSWRGGLQISAIKK